MIRSLILFAALACLGCQASTSRAADARPQVITSYQRAAAVQTVRFPLARGFVRCVRNRPCPACYTQPAPVPLPTPPADDEPRETAAIDADENKSGGDDAVGTSVLAFLVAAGGSFLAAARRSR